VSAHVDLNSERVLKPIEHIDQTGSDALLKIIDQTDTQPLNWAALVRIAYSPYSAKLGNLALLIIFAIPFLMMWIRQQNSLIPAIVGMILGGFIIALLPEEYHLAAMGFIGLSILAVIFGIVKETG
jgi:hypothetical protein